MDPKTLCEMYFAAVAFRRPDRMLFKRGTYQPISSDEIARRVRLCAGGMAASGIAKGDRVAILSYNRPEWAIVDYAALTLGAASVPVYSTLPADQVGYILQNSGAKIVFVENEGQAKKVGGLRTVSMESASGVESFEEFLKRGESFTDEEHRRRAADVGEEDLATLIYTSGTTGVPKGVMLTHRNLVSNMLASCEALAYTSEDVAMSFLPLSHIFERLVDYALFHRASVIAYAESIDKVSENLLEVRPTVMSAVPRFYEKVYARINESVAAMPPRKKSMFDWASSVGALEATYRMRGEKPPFGLRWRFWWASKIVLKKLHARVGGRIRIFTSGGAPLSRDIAEFFFSLGFTVLEGYGLTETSPVVAVNREGGVKLGTVGPLLRGVEAKIASDGEILVKGPNIMKGYFNMPAETAEVLEDGWFHTGDIGELDTDGYLKITDRKKDLLKTSGGKYIAPQPIENKLKMNPLIANAIVIGDKRKFPSVIVVPNYDLVRKRLDSKSANPELARDVKVRTLFRNVIDDLNKGLAQHEALKKFELLDADFTIDSGELTPTMKVKRRVVEAKYKPLIEEMYRE